MFNLKLLLLLALISFSLQDSHCLIIYEKCSTKYEELQPKKAETIENCENEVEDEDGTYCFECKKDYSPSNDGTKCISFPHCEYFEDGEEKCEICEDGYALSYNKKECISFENCVQLGEGNNKCSRCIEYYHNNTAGKCERTLCSDYDENDVCTSCYDGYYLRDDKTCEKINIKYCLKVSSNDQNECMSCVNDLAIDDKKCVIPETLVKGCSRYNKEGKCTSCTSYYTLNSDKGICEFKGCDNGRIKSEYCYRCEAGFYSDEGDGLCTSYKDGSKDTGAANINKVEYSLIILILALLI